jgi:site-specific DNA recombinase
MSEPIRYCAIYTRKSTDEGLEKDFNSLEAQREACEAFIKSQRHEGWEALQDCYDDGGFSGGTLNRPALQRLLDDCKTGRVHTIVVYKIDRLTRALADFAKMVELFDTHKVNFVSVTQQFNTTTSMGRLTLNVLLSFAQFEREVTGERIRDKIAASKAKGMWMGGHIPLGYEKDGRTLKINPAEAKLIQWIFVRYLELGSSLKLRNELNTTGKRTKQGRLFFLGHVLSILSNPIYIGQIRHRKQIFQGNHPALITPETWQQVQDLLAHNRHTQKHRLRAKERSILCGKLVDANGYTMTPSYSNKNGKRYRYYVSQGQIQGLAMQPATVRKIPATELEKTLLIFVYDLLGSLTQISLVLPQADLALHQRAQTLAKEWHDLQPTQQSLLLSSVVHQVKLELHQITVSVCPSGLHQVLGGTPLESQPIPFIITIKLKQVAGGATMIVQPTEGKAGGINYQILTPIARAYQWQQQLIKGEVSGLTAIARRDGLNPRVVRRQLALAWLSPTIVTLIANGHEPSGWMLETLYPLTTQSWPEQHKSLGIA